MKRNSNKKEITLMTLLANEATADARKLLKKYNKPDAKNCADLEVKLAQLYFDTPDKLAIEKDLAEIHPHKNWLLKRTKVEEVVKPELVVETKANADGDCGNPNCPVHGKCCGSSSADGDSSKANYGSDNTRVIQLQNDQLQKQNPMMYAVSYVGIIAIAGIVFYALINKTKI